MVSIQIEFFDPDAAVEEFAIRGRQNSSSSVGPAKPAAPASASPVK